MKGRPARAKNLFPIRSAARLTRLSIDTLRAWEKRYAAVQPVRQNGIRLYTEADVDRLSLLRDAVDHGHSIGQVAGLSNKDLMGLTARADTSRRVLPNEAPLEKILHAIDAFDHASADRELGRLASLMPPRDLIHSIALPLLRIIGERWHEQSLRIAQEHLTSQLLRNLLGGMMRIYAPPHPSSTLLTATFSDDLHEFGILISAILAAGAGLGVLHLGANLPVKELSYATKRSGVDVVLVSITDFNDRMLREEQLRSLRASVPNNVEVWVGVNPPNTTLQFKGVRVLRNFEDLEREIQRVGGKF
jgi:DNA-binding transcriptional MerR regulator/methylmalonyl-CoA mutase cobalamin-binding subunit